MHLYLHIPFCKQACHYCDFHFSTNTKGKREMVEALVKEIELRKNYLPENTLDTIYFGGGTPSLLNETELDLILNAVYKNFKVSSNAEFTLEANPDDLNSNKIKQIVGLGINRLSIGIQSFHAPHLKYLNRAHSSAEASQSVKMAQENGIDNISVDLIYAIPAPDHAVLYRDISLVSELNIQHVSAYCLTIEPQTTFGNWLKKGKLHPVDEAFAAEQFEILIKNLRKSGFEQYEISNFARDEKYSRHNSSYWKARPYLGIGPSAHSYNLNSREYNVSNNAKYVKELNNNNLPSTVEVLSLSDKVNEYLLTGLRTKWGINLLLVEDLSNNKFLMERQNQIDNLLASEMIQITDNIMTLTQQGKLFADRIAGDLFME